VSAALVVGAVGGVVGAVVIAGVGAVVAGVTLVVDVALVAVLVLKLVGGVGMSVITGTSGLAWLRTRKDVLSSFLLAVDS
jgi:hypothetical protein